jgi:endonuclease-3
LTKLFPQKSWDMLAHILIFHGRRICTARKPACAACPVNDVCPSAFRAEQVGRKPARVRTKLAPMPVVARRAAPVRVVRKPAAQRASAKRV